MSQWVTVLAALLTPTIAVVAALVAYRQWKTASNKLKLDLFDRRFAIYEATRRFLSFVVSKGVHSNEDLMRLMVDTRAAKFLLAQSVSTYLWKDLHNKAIELKILHDEMAGLPVGEERTNNVRKQRECKDWLCNQYEVVEGKFEPYLRLGH